MVFVIGLAVAVFVVGVRLVPGTFGRFRTRDVEYMLSRKVPLGRRIGVFALELALMYMLFVIVVLYSGLEVSFLR